MYIAYDIKNGVVYAKLCVSRRTGKTTAKDYINLGRVIDKEHGIYKNRERGVFTYSIADNVYGKPDASVILPESLSARREKLILDFGDTFFLDAYVRKMGLRPSIDATGYTNPDTLHSMICCYILCSAANCHAASWREGNYARLMYPKASLTSRRISDFLAAIGGRARNGRFSVNTSVI